MNTISVPLPQEGGNEKPMGEIPVSNVTEQGEEPSEIDSHQDEEPSQERDDIHLEPLTVENVTKVRRLRETA